MPRGGEIGSRGRPAFSFPTVIPRVVGLVHSPPNSERGLLFLHIPSPAVFVNLCHSDFGEIKSQNCPDLDFPNC